MERLAAEARWAGRNLRARAGVACRHRDRAPRDRAEGQRAAVRDGRLAAVHLAIGASHGALARTAMLEGAVLVGAAALAGAALAYAGAPVLVEYFPPSLVLPLL